MCAAHLLCRQLIELSLFVLELPPHSLQLSISLCLQCDAERDTQAMKASVSNLCLSPRQSVCQSVSQSEYVGLHSAAHLQIRKLFLVFLPLSCDFGLARRQRRRLRVQLCLGSLLLS
jgi:hypothetical protein